MPTISSLPHVSFVNWGPLTTTWTAPAQCSTQSLMIKVAPSSDIFDQGWFAQCSVIGNDCLPTGTRSVEPTMPMATIPGDAQFTYYSPGVLCPAGFATVGVASRDADNPVTSSGSQIFPTTFVAYNPVTFIMEALEPSETAVFCCPSSMTVNPSVGCYSTLKDYKPTTGCNIHYLNQGRKMTEGPSGPISVRTTSFAASETSDLVGVTIHPIVTLVHRASDIESAEPTATSNAAIRLNSKSTTWDGLGAVLGVSALGMILGAAIVIPF